LKFPIPFDLAGFFISIGGSSHFLFLLFAFFCSSVLFYSFEFELIDLLRKESPLAFEKYSISENMESPSGPLLAGLAAFLAFGTANPDLGTLASSRSSTF